LYKSEFLQDERRRQHGEGLCVPALLSAYFLLFSKYKLGTEPIAKLLGTTTGDGTHDGVLLDFLRAARVPHYEEANCSGKRLVGLLGALPENAVTILSIWDKRPPRPGFDMTNDYPEPHNLWAISAHYVLGQWMIRAFDPDTYYGGLKLVPLRNLMEVWHDGRESRYGQFKGNGNHAGQANIGWFLVIGAEENEVFKRVGPPEFSKWEANKKRVSILDSGLAVYSKALPI